MAESYSHLVSRIFCVCAGLTYNFRWSSLRLNSHNHFHSVEVNVVTSHSMTVLRAPKVLLPGDKAVLAEQRNVPETDVIDLFLNVLTAPRTFELVVARILLKTYVEEGAGQPLASGHEVANSAEADLCVHVVDEIQMKLAL